jgi:hypothetical protein
MRPGPVFGEPRSAGREGALEAIAAVRAGGQDVSCLKPLAFGSITDRASDDAWHSDSVPAPKGRPLGDVSQVRSSSGQPPWGSYPVSYKVICTTFRPPSCKAPLNTAPAVRSEFVHPTGKLGKSLSPS